MRDEEIIDKVAERLINSSLDSIKQVIKHAIMHQEARVKFTTRLTEDKLYLNTYLAEDQNDHNTSQI